MKHLAIITLTTLSMMSFNSHAGKAAEFSGQAVQHSIATSASASAAVVTLPVEAMLVVGHSIDHVVTNIGGDSTGEGLEVTEDIITVSPRQAIQRQSQ